MKNRKTLTELLHIKHPILMAPMFLVSNTKMIISALQMGCTAAFPALNYRNNKALKKAIQEIRESSDQAFGVNLIVNRSNPKYKAQLDTLLELKVDFIITSLGNPKEVIELCKPKGIKVFCDVIDVQYAKKVEQLGADALIAVNSKAGGHCGNLEAEQLIRLLLNNTNLPIISAGGISCSKDLKQMMEWGASGVSVGTLFIASSESNVSDDYKRAIVTFSDTDIVKTTKLTGTPLTVINTPYVQEMGVRSNFLEWLIHHSPRFKKYAKLILAWRGMSKVKKAAFKAGYQNVWCAGPSIQSVKTIKPVKEIIKDLLGD